jgi:hypothetical protein
MITIHIPLISQTVGKIVYIYILILNLYELLVHYYITCSNFMKTVLMLIMTIPAEFRIPCFPTHREKMRGLLVLVELK